MKIGFKNFKYAYDEKFMYDKNLNVFFVLMHDLADIIDLLDFFLKTNYRCTPSIICQSKMIPRFAVC